MRVLIFSDLRAARRLGRDFRKAGLYADSTSDDAYWLLRVKLADPSKRKPPPLFDSALGWVRREVTPETYEHRDASKLRGRRPVLLYGDSFANCATAKKDCWEGLLERSALGGSFRMLNYGAGGYGFGQIVLLMERSLSLYEGLDPVVIVSVLVEGDLDRSVLGFRAWPKARFLASEDGGLKLEGTVAPSFEEHLQRHPIGIRSYAWRYLLYGTDLLPVSWRGREAKLERKQELNRRILRRAVATLEAAEVDYFFLLFSSKHGVLMSEPGWQQRLLVDGLEASGASYVRTAPFLLSAAEQQNCEPEAFYIEKGRGKNHHTVEGNAVAFEAIERGLRGAF